LGIGKLWTQINEEKSCFLAQFFVVARYFLHSGHLLSS
jgi:hypothetical protein